MRKILSRSVLTMTIISLMMANCSPDETLEPNHNQKITIAEARQWFESNIKPQNESSGNLPRTPVWDFATITNFKGKDMVSTPLRFTENKRYNKGSRSTLLISKDENGKIGLQVLKAVGNKSYMEHVKYKIGLSDFSGTVEMQDWEGDFVSGEYYSDGKVTATLGQPGEKSLANARIKGQYIVIWTDWYQQVCINGDCSEWVLLDSFPRVIYINDGQSSSDFYGIFYSDGGGGGGGGGGENGGGGGGSGCPYGPNCNDPVPFDDGSVTEMEVVTPPDPCQQAALLAANNGFKAKMTELSTKTGSNFESGYLLQNTSSGYGYIAVTGNPNEPWIDFTVTSKIDGYIHSHYTGTYSSFSMGDVRAIYDIYSQGNINDVNTFTTGVVTSYGTSYTMMIEDINSFLAFSQQNFAADTDFTALEELYDTWYQLYLPLGNITSARELALLKVLENSGLKIFKGNSSFTNWGGIQNQNSQIVTINCD